MNPAHRGFIISINDALVGLDLIDGSLAEDVFLMENSDLAALGNLADESHFMLNDDDGVLSG